MKTARSILWFLMPFVLIFGCSDSGGNNAPTEGDSEIIQEQESEELGPNQIGPDGGRIELEDGTVLDIPAGALTEVRTFTVRETYLEPPSRYAKLSPIYEFGPNGLEFETPVTITIPYDDSTLPGDMTDSDIKLMWTVAGETTVYEEKTPTLQDGLATLEVSHFSYGFVGYIPIIKLCEDGDLRCTGNILEKCTNETWETETNCLADDRTCTLTGENIAACTCTEDSLKCKNNSIEICHSNEWELQTTCGEGLECNDKIVHACVPAVVPMGLTLITRDSSGEHRGISLLEVSTGNVYRDQDHSGLVPPGGDEGLSGDLVASSNLSNAGYAVVFDREQETLKLYNPARAELGSTMRPEKEIVVYHQSYEYKITDVLYNAEGLSWATRSNPNDLISFEPDGDIHNVVNFGDSGQEYYSRPNQILPVGETMWIPLPSINQDATIAGPGTVSVRKLEDGSSLATVESQDKKNCRRLNYNLGQHKVYAACMGSMSDGAVVSTENGVLEIDPDTYQITRTIDADALTGAGTIDAEMGVFSYRGVWVIVANSEGVYAYDLTDASQLTLMEAEMGEQTIDAFWVDEVDSKLYVAQGNSIQRYYINYQMSQATQFGNPIVISDMGTVSQPWRVFQIGRYDQFECYDGWRRCNGSHLEVCEANEWELLKKCANSDMECLDNDVPACVKEQAVKGLTFVTENSSDHTTNASLYDISDWNAANMKKDVIQASDGLSTQIVPSMNLNDEGQATIIDQGTNTIHWYNPAGSHAAQVSISLGLGDTLVDTLPLEDGLNWAVTSQSAEIHVFDRTGQDLTTYPLADAADDNFTIKPLQMLEVPHKVWILAEYMSTDGTTIGPALMIPVKSDGEEIGALSENAIVKMEEKKDCRKFTYNGSSFTLFATCAGGEDDQGQLVPEENGILEIHAGLGELKNDYSYDTLGSSHIVYADRGVDLYRDQWLLFVSWGALMAYDIVTGENISFLPIGNVDRFWVDEYNSKLYVVDGKQLTRYSISYMNGTITEDGPAIPITDQVGWVIQEMGLY